MRIKFYNDNYYNLITSKGYYMDLNSINLNLDSSNQILIKSNVEYGAKATAIFGDGTKARIFSNPIVALWNVSWESMFKNNKNPVIYATSTKEYFCAYWGQNIKSFKNLFWISAIICFIFLLTYIGSYNVVFYMNINNPELNINQDVIEIYVKSILGILNIILTLILSYLYFHKNNFNCVFLYNFLLIIEFVIIIVLPSFSNSIFKHSFSSQFMAIPIISWILYVINQLYLQNIIFSIYYVHKKDNFYDPNEWWVKIFDPHLLNESKSKLEYYWKINEKISSEYNITFQGLSVLTSKKPKLLKDAYFLFEYNSKIYSIKFCNNSLFILNNKNKEIVNKDITKLILIYEKNWQ